MSKKIRRPKVVVSLTTLPSRIKSVTNTLKSILTQSLVPNKIYVNLPKKTSRGEEYVIPKSLLNLVKKHKIIEILRCRTDYGPGTKIYPVLAKERGKNTRIITIDDDSKYPKKSIETLVKYSLERPNEAIAYSAWNINPQTLDIEDYSSFSTKLTWGQECAPAYMDIIEGWAAALYVRKFFMKGNKDQRVQFIDTMRKGPKECFFVDDVWISAWLAKKKIKIFILGEKLQPDHTTTVLCNTLHGNKNVIARNKKCVKKYIKYFKEAGLKTYSCKQKIKKKLSE